MNHDKRPDDHDDGQQNPAVWPLNPDEDVEADSSPTVIAKFVLANFADACAS